MKKLPGKPDIYLSKYKTAIFINGCFWHGHNKCKYFKVPDTRTDWWINKINKTKERDIKNYKALAKIGIDSYIIWECQLQPKKTEATLTELFKVLRANEFH